MEDLVRVSKELYIKILSRGNLRATKDFVRVSKEPYLRLKFKCLEELFGLGLIRI